MSDIAWRFRKAFNGQKNVLTPNIVRFGKVGSYYYELSRGSGFGGGTIYGLTLIDHNNKPMHDISSYYTEMRQVEQHIAEMESCDAYGI